MKRALVFWLVSLISSVAASAQVREPTLRDEVRAHGFVWRGVIADYTLSKFDQLVQKSDLIIRGRVVDEAPRLSANERHVWTDYTIEVQGIFKDREGLTKVGDRVVASKEGGNLLLEHKPVRVDTPNFPRVAWIQPHLFFIQRWTDPGAQAENVFTGGPVGVWVIKDDKIVCDTKHKEIHPITARFCNTGESEFLEVLKARITSHEVSERSR